MCRILALACALLRQTACKLQKKAASTVTSAKHGSLNAAIIRCNHSFAATGMAAVADANYTTAEQLSGHQCCQGCKEKNWRCGLDWGKLGKWFSSVLANSFARLGHVGVCLLCCHYLSCSCTMFALMLCNVPKGQTSNPCWKVWIRSAFLVLIQLPWLVCPQTPN